MSGITHALKVITNWFHMERRLIAMGSVMSLVVTKMLARSSYNEID